MTGETIRSLLEPLIGKSGSIALLVRNVGPISFATGETRKLMGVEQRPDGLIHITRESGWTVIDPTEVPRKRCTGPTTGRRPAVACPWRGTGHGFSTRTTRAGPC